MFYTRLAEASLIQVKHKLHTWSMKVKYGSHPQSYSWDLSSSSQQNHPEWSEIPAKLTCMGKFRKEICDEVNSH